MNCRINFSDFNLSSFKISGKFIPFRLKALAVSAPRSIEFNEPRFFAVHYQRVEIVISEHNNISIVFWSFASTIVIVVVVALRAVAATAAGVALRSTTKTIRSYFFNLSICEINDITSSSSATVILRFSLAFTKEFQSRISRNSIRASNFLNKKKLQWDLTILGRNN